MQDKTIVHMDMDTFFVSVERLKNAAFAKVPLMVGGMSDRSVVASCSYETRKYGVRSGMSMKMARYLCPDAMVVKGDFDSYSKYSDMVTEIIQKRAPVFEKTSIDEFYMDVSGMDRFFGCMKWTQELRAYIIKESGLPISYGLSINKTVSKIATGEGKPNGEKRVLPAEVQPFLNPLPVKRIPGIGQHAQKLLQTMGVKTIETLSQMPPQMLEKLMGKYGITVWEKANGIDDAPVLPYSERKSISTEETFDTDTTDVVKLHELLLAMVEKLTFQLRQLNQLTGCVTVKIRYSNFDTHTTQAAFYYTSNDHTLIEKVKGLFEKLYDRRLLIRLVGVKLSKLVYGWQQTDLFEDTEHLSFLYQAMDKIRAKHGDKMVVRAKGFEPEKTERKLIK
jgi:DNA polymerase-4